MSKDGDFSSHFYEIKEGSFSSTKLEEILNDHHTIQVNRGNIFGH